MQPFIKDGDIVTVSPLVKSAFHKGRVVAFCHPRTGRLVLHRVVSCSGNNFVARGDNCSAPDGRLEKSVALGYVSRVERAGNPVVFGHGVERFAIAVLSRFGLLIHAIALARRMSGMSAIGLRAHERRDDGE